MNAKEEKEMLRQLRQMKLSGFADAYLDQKTHEPDYTTMPFGDRLKELVDAAWDLRTDNRTDRLVRKADFAIPHAQLEEVDYCMERSFDVRTFNSLKNNDWLDRGFHVIIVGCAGCGKTYLSNALGTNACRNGYSVRCFAASGLLGKLSEAGDTETGSQLFREITKCQLLILDEFLLTPLPENEIRILFEVVAERTKLRHSLLICSHYGSDGWLERLGNSPLAESILDRILPAAYRLNVESSISMRTKYECLTPAADTASSAVDPA